MRSRTGPRRPACPGHNLGDRDGAKAERMPEAGGAVRMLEAGGAAHLAGAGLPGRVICMKGRPVPVAEYGVMAAPGPWLRLAVAHRAVEIRAKAAPARPRPSRPG